MKLNKTTKPFICIQEKPLDKMNDNEWDSSSRRGFKSPFHKNLPIVSALLNRLVMTLSMLLSSHNFNSVR